MHYDIDISLLTVATVPSQNTVAPNKNNTFLVSFVLSPKPALANKFSREVVEWFGAPRDSATQKIAPSTPHLEKAGFSRGPDRPKNDNTHRESIMTRRKQRFIAAIRRAASMMTPDTWFEMDKTISTSSTTASEILVLIEK